MGRIKLLSRPTADKIAAGEVIERPLSVVKELLENSIDAGADYIEIEIRDGGVGLIRIKDNGCGMDGEDLALAFERHATSKIQEVQDLYRLQTFGFRGEALPSIAAVAQVEMSSSSAAETVGHKIRFAGGVQEGMEEIGAPHGTIIEVRNLFYNLPARRKFLKSNSIEAGLIGDLVSKYGLGYPQIRFKLVVNGQSQLDTAGLNTTGERMVALYGNTVQKLLVPISHREIGAGQYLEAWLVREEMTRNNRNQEVFFVNGRLIKSTELTQALEEGYYTLMAKGRFPIAVVKLELPGQDLDVNIHPAKTEIKINRFDLLQPKLVDQFKDALWEASITKNAFLPPEQLTGRIEEKQQVKANASAERATAAAKMAETKMAGQERLISSSTVQQSAKPSQQQEPQQKAKAVISEKPQQNRLFAIPTIPEQKIAETAIPYQGPLFQTPTASAAGEMVQEPQQVTVKELEGVTLLGQLNQSFIVGQNHQGLLIIDQHTCHERILYERFMAEENDKTRIREGLLIPAAVNLTPQQDSVLVKHIFALQELGFAVESFGERCYLIRSIPFGLQEDQIESFFIDLLDDLGASKAITPAVMKEKILTTAACKGAVKANWKLTEVEMLTLLHDLSQVENAHTCPHGRPIIYQISMGELYKIFKRGTYQE